MLTEHYHSSRSSSLSTWEEILIFEENKICKLLCQDIIPSTCTIRHHKWCIYLVAYRKSCIRSYYDVLLLQDRAPVTATELLTLWSQWHQRYVTHAHSPLQRCIHIYTVTRFDMLLNVLRCSYSLRRFFLIFFQQEFLVHSLILPEVCSVCVEGTVVVGISK